MGGARHSPPPVAKLADLSPCSSAPSTAEHTPATVSLLANSIKLRVAGTQCVACIFPLLRMGVADDIEQPVFFAGFLVSVSECTSLASRWLVRLRRSRWATGARSRSSSLNSAFSRPDALRRHLDTARIYRNERDCLQAVHKFQSASQVPNSGNGSIWLTSKVTSKEHGTELTRKAVDESVKLAEEFGLKWDLFLLHDPCGGKEKRLEAWKVLIEKRDEGKLKAIGVSNFVRLLSSPLSLPSSQPPVETHADPSAPVARFCLFSPFSFLSTYRARSISSRSRRLVSSSRTSTRCVPIRPFSPPSPVKSTY